MNVIIISNGCPICEKAKTALTPLNPKVLDWSDLPRDERNDLMVNLAQNNGDPTAYPAVFIGGQFVNIKWADAV